MIQIERYLLRTATTACVSGLVVLTGVVWVTQALRQIDLITSKGQTILLFLLITALALPSLVAFIAPVALFAGILYTLNKLNGDSELVVMAAQACRLPGCCVRWRCSPGLYLRAWPSSISRFSLGVSGRSRL